MKEKEIIQEFTKGFNRSSKVMEYKLGIDEARLLNMLCYKHNYFCQTGQLEEIKGKYGFYITIPNIQVETNIKPYTISKAIKRLEKEKLIEVYRIGLPARNYYIVNGDLINKFEKDHSEDYLMWKAKIDQGAQNDRNRFNSAIENSSIKDNEILKENVAESLIIQQSRENSTTCESKTQPLVSEFSPVTNNKLTNNKILKISTNLTSEEEDLSIIEDLTELITCLMHDMDDQVKAHDRVFHFTKNLVRGNANFHESTDDALMIDRICDYSLDPNVIASKILKNAKAIEQGKKSNRFGNLFTGLDAMNQNLELIYGT